MAVFKQDTIYYRHDHPGGYLFAEGSEEPSVADGWSPSPDRILAAPEKHYECTTFDAYEGLLQSERAANRLLTAQAQEAREAFVKLFAEFQAAAQAHVEAKAAAGAAYSHGG